MGYEEESYPEEEEEEEEEEVEAEESLILGLVGPPKSDFPVCPKGPRQCIHLREPMPWKEVMPRRKVKRIEWLGRTGIYVPRW